MLLMSAWWKAALCCLVMALPAGAAEPGELPPECERDEASLACTVAIETWRALSAYMGSVDSLGELPGEALGPAMYLPRLLIAEGELANAIESFLDRLPEDGGSAWDGRLALRYADLERSLWAIAADPLPVLSAESLTTLETLDLERAGPWAMIAAARTWARAGDHERARTTFRALAEAYFGPGKPGGRLRHLERLLMAWAAAGYGDDALAFVAAWPRIDAAYATLSVVEGMAITGDVEATLAAADTLQGALRLVGELSVAEAERRAGDPAAALARLDGLAATLEHESRWLAHEYRVRIVQGYALLGDFDAMRDAAGTADDNAYAYHHFWPPVAPLVACHDLALAVELVTRRDRLMADLGLPEAWDLVDILVVAARQGQGEEAFAVARNARRPLDRTLLLMAVLTGLLQAEHSPPDAPPCSTMMALPS